jgi:hypothetical protein
MMVREDERIGEADLVHAIVIVVSEEYWISQVVVG